MNASAPQCQIGLIGLAVMGQNLALNIARHGFPIAVYNRTTEKTDAFVAEQVRSDDPVVGTRSIEAFVAALARPRRILLMVKAGAAVDATIEALLPHLDPGDLIIDGGNSHPRDTERRVAALPERGFRFLGMGVSGGEEGALHGPSLMPGGSREAYDELAPILTRIAAQVADGPCVTYLGPGASGHFVKMVHNGIEYGDMQLIAETYDLLRSVAGLDNDRLAATFARWNDGVLESFLIEITAQIFGRDDTETGARLVDVILDVAGQKGTGKWTAEIALELGVPIPTIQAAVLARGLSSMYAERQHASTVLHGPRQAPTAAADLADAAHDALYASKICSYAQGLDLLARASREYDWHLDLAEIARIWKGGCIIRARMLDRIQAAFGREPQLGNLLLDRELGGWIDAAQSRWRAVVATAAQHGIPTLAMAGSLSYFDSYRRARLPQNLTQAQRDFFGAHTFERTDRERGRFFHADWQ